MQTSSFSYGNTAILFIEEPEAHLFPNEQKMILELLGEVFNSNWIDIENKMLDELDYKKLNSTNLKLFYENIIEKVRIINLSRELNYKNSIKSENIDLLEELNKEIEELKLLRKKETQINRVAEIQTKLLKKIEERNKILRKE